MSVKDGVEAGVYLFLKESCSRVGVDTNPALILTLTITITLTLTLTQAFLKKTIDPKPAFY